MSSIRKWLAVGGATVAVAGMVAIFAPSASAAAAPKMKCPSGGIPAPGSTVMGGLEVDDVCNLSAVTVYGGVTVDPLPPDFSTFPAFGLTSGRVSGGIVVNGGSVGLGWDPATGELTNQPVTIEGKITLNQPFIAILAGTTDRGGITTNGGYDVSQICDGEPGCFTQPQICGNNIFGDVTIRDVNNAQVFLGDPGEQFFANADCAGNTIHGSVFMKDTNFARQFDGEPGEIEGDTVTGSVHVDHSTAEVYGNTIGGSLLCTNASLIHPAPPGDPSGTTNTVNGTNTCF
jgi:hypothetical protein